MTENKQNICKSSSNKSNKRFTSSRFERELDKAHKQKIQELRQRKYQKQSRGKS